MNGFRNSQSTPKMLKREEASHRSASGALIVISSVALRLLALFSLNFFSKARVLAISGSTARDRRSNPSFTTILPSL